MNRPLEPLRYARYNPPTKTKNRYYQKVIQLADHASTYTTEPLRSPLPFRFASLKMTKKIMDKQKKEKGDVSKNTGHAAGMQGSATNYADNVPFGAARGHGFAAEKANHLYDKFTGEDAKIVGGDNAKNGADRLVNGQLIQTKYCASGSKCISETFDENGLFRYLDGTGKPMQIEVPSDMYDAAVQAMEERIKKGQIPNVTDPATAKEIVRKGRFTYEQARNVAKAGTIESLTYDAVNGIKLAGAAMGLTALLSFATNIWQGKSKSDSLDAACFDGICVGGIAWVTSILTAQVGRTGVESSLRAGTDWAVKQMNPKIVNALANAFRNGNNIYGASAANHVSKILRGHLAVTIIVTTVLSVDDFIALFSKEISGKQAFKKICKTASGVAGGAGGMWAGAAVGAKFGVAGGPVGIAVGSTIGGIIGGVTGGVGASKVVGAGLDATIDDDSIDIGNLMERTFGHLAHGYLLSQIEADAAIANFHMLDMEKTVCAIHAAENREEYTRELILPFVERVVNNRPPVFRPSQKKLVAATEKLIIQFESSLA